MSIRPSNAAIALVVVLVGILLTTLVPHSPFRDLGSAEAANASYSYAENGTAAVATFTASDPDGDPIKWSLGGDDAEDFTIDGGVLAFKSSPNFESPADEGENNVYDVTVMASGGELMVTVTVTNVDESGMVSLDRPQPQAGRTLTATLTDEDGEQSGETWQWSRSASKTGPWTDIDKATSAARAPASGDVDYYLRATVTYTDKFGGGKTASAVTANMVEARTVANAAPDFKDQDDDDNVTTNPPAGIQVNRKVEEGDAGTLVGKPVTATDADGDILVYSLSGTDAPTTATSFPKFEIDSASGQIKAKVKLNFEADAVDGDTDGNNCAQQNACVVTVTAMDPSGAKTTQDVKIAITGANEPPAFDSTTGTPPVSNAKKVLWLKENDDTETLYTASTVASGEELASNAYSADDPDTGHDTVAYTLEGADADFFAIGATTGNLTVPDNNKANYEEKKSYSITVVVTSGPSASSPLNMSLRQDVTVNVVDQPDLGTITLSQREPQVGGAAIVATLTDPDGGVAVSAWKWYRHAETNNSCSGVTPGSGGTEIIGATSSTYAPKAADLDQCLEARATYTDNQTTTAVTAAEVTDRGAQTAKPDNAAPVFPDQDATTPGDQSDSTTRSVAENTKANMSINPGVTAADGDDPKDLLMYTLSGADADSFAIDRDLAVIKTKAELDYETKKVYMVTVTATDPSGASDSISVTINVTDENDNAAISGSASQTYAENGTAAVARFTATDQDGDPIVWSLGGDDAKDFTITGGSLTFKDSPDFEKPHDEDTNNEYKVTVMASGGKLAVTVTVTNVDESGVVTIDKPQPQAGRSLAATLADEDGEVSGESWQWSRAASASGPWIAIQNATNQSRPPTSDDVNSYLRAVVTYTDKFGAGKTAWAVTTNAVEARTLANSAPKYADEDDTADEIQVSRSVMEGAAGSLVGKPAVASDADGDILVYTISGTDAGATSPKFEIDSASGQIKTKVALNYESSNGAADNCATGTVNNCSVTVTATDPSGAKVEQPVTITITDANEAPAFTTAANAKSEVWVEENVDTVVFYTDSEGSGGSNNTTISYVATDPDGLDDAVAYSVEGADKDAFTATGGTLAVATDVTPDYEKKKSYSITIVVVGSDSSDDTRKTMSLRHDVTVNVIDTEDDGTVTLSQREPQVGRPVVATLTDPDGGVNVTKWEWSKTTGQDGTEVNCDNVEYTAANKIDDATSSTYTPVEADLHQCLVAKATYTDNIANAVGADDDTAQETVDRGTQAADPANTAPAFPDQDATTPGDQSDSTTRSVAENTKADMNVGSAVEADDADTPADLLMYTLGGADADSFTIGRDDGQIKTKAELDYETKRVYNVTVTATDPSGATDSISVTINVTDVNDGATITPGTGGGTNNAPTFAASSATRNVSENVAAGTAIGAPVTATDADGDALTYSVSGADASAFSIHASTGQLMTSATLDYETKSSYTVTVAASDGTDSATISVTINVNDVSEAGYDLNGNGTIERNEVISAISDYLGGQIERSEVIGLIGRYLSGN